MYICQVCGGYPEANDRAVIVFTDKIRAEIKGHRDCIDDIEAKTLEIRKKSKKVVSVKALFKAMDLDVEDYLVDW